MLLICRDQIRFDVRVHGRLFVWILSRFRMDVRCAWFAQKIADQYAALTINESVDC